MARAHQADTIPERSGADRFIASRRRLAQEAHAQQPVSNDREAEGGCGVIGVAASVPVRGRHLIQAAAQMHNRGNGKGGGLAAAGLSPAQMGVSAEVLRDATLLQIAYLDPEARAEVERGAFDPAFDILQGYRVPAVDDWRDVPGLEIAPPEVWRYFVRVRPPVLDGFAAHNGLEDLPSRAVEDEYVYQNSFHLNQRFYASLGQKRAFVLCHGRDLLVFKIVGHAEQAAAYYHLGDLEAHIWIAHQRYPTRGRVWHPGGAHPFIGLNEALVHNGDFSNYHAVATYLRQRNIVPLFLTDTEVSALLFDLLDRTYAYPLEATIEALAPTTERDFSLLPPERQDLYRAVQAAHLHASPDGPWFFIVARSQPDNGQWQLLGITDTSMLRPQVFALHEGKVQVGVIASEKQAIDAALQSLSAEDERICPVADRYWNARGGSHTDGGAFQFTVQQAADGMAGPVPDRHRGCSLIVTDKFGARVTTPADQVQNNPSTATVAPPRTPGATAVLRSTASLAVAPWVVAGPEGVDAAWRWLSGEMPGWTYGELTWFTQRMTLLAAEGDEAWAFVVGLLTRLRDRQVDPGKKRRASVLALVERALERIFMGIPALSAFGHRRLSRVDWPQARQNLHGPEDGEETLLLDAAHFPPEGDDSAARLIVEAANLGWRRFIAFGWRGGRFCGCGLGLQGAGVRIDVYGSSGDYLGSGLQGAEVHVHGHAQDQVGQILTDGKLVIHGDVGQTFLYGAKGGEAYVLGNAAGRPLINAVGRPRVVINGSCLDYLAESFMAGDPLNGGGFAILNGIEFDAHGQMIAQPTPYPGGNLFSLASGGAIYVRDPHRLVTGDQLNGGTFVPLTSADWALILPYLQENERLFGIGVDNLLSVNGERRQPEEIYRKIIAVHLTALT